MEFRPDPGSPIPLYHQIAETIRYRIATGALAPGAGLPSLRDGAAAWGVNLHTVRQAYKRLEEAGLVSTVPPRGTVVLPNRESKQRDSRSRAVDEFVAEVLRTARRRHDLGAGELIELLGRAAVVAPRAVPRVHVLECSETQSADLATQLEARWMVRAEPWSLSRPGEPPEGTTVATYFHYNDIRRLWPERLARIRFVSIRPDASIARRLDGFRAGRRTAHAVLVERDAAMARNIAADLSVVLPSSKWKIVPKVTKHPQALLKSGSGGIPILFSPRMWDDLPEVARRDPRAVEVRYVFVPDELEALARELGWIRRPVPARSAT